MKPKPELIERFLKDQCTDSEAEIVHAWLQEHPEELERHVPLHDLLVENEHQTDIATSARILKSIRKSYRPAKLILLSRYAVAASILAILAVAGMKFFHNSDKQETVVAKNAIAPALTLINNNSTKLIRERLSDSSVVTVYPNSSLQFLPAFEKNKRDLYLKGKSAFNVSKDRSRPFTVYAAGISTTALGTEFTVTVKENQQVFISLLEGLVKIRSQNPAEKNAFIIMHAGDKLVVSSGRFDQHILTHKAAVNKKKTRVENEEAIPEKNTLAFKNEPLKNVLKRIEEKFYVTIDYSKAPGMEEKLFTGSFLETEDLEFIIRLICQLHGFTYRIEGKIVTIQQ